MADDKNSPVKEAKETKKKSEGLTEQVLKAKGKESLDNIQSGGKAVTVKLTKGSKIYAEFKKNVGEHIKKGHRQYLSELAYAAYDRKGAVKKI